MYHFVFQKVLIRKKYISTQGEAGNLALSVVALIWKICTTILDKSCTKSIVYILYIIKLFLIV